MLLPEKFLEVVKEEASEMVACELRFVDPDAEPMGCAFLRRPVEHVLA
jgi:hypothetical protein